jgi:probable F420-dependent oxidoreductase
MRLMRFGFALPGRGPLATPEALTKLAEKADALRYASVFVTDHVVIPTSYNSTYPYAASGRFTGDWTNGYLEPMAMMGVLVGLTSRVKIGTSVLVVPYRNPVVTAKMLATLDVMSGGRMILGAGVGWMKEEFENLKAPPFDDRGRVTDEYIKAFRELWTSDSPSFDGKYCSFSDLMFLPKPVQKPAIPIWIGGHSKAALRRAGELGDGWHPIGGVPTIPLEPEDITRDLEVIAGHAQKAGRNPRDIRVALKGSLFDREKQIAPGKRRRFLGSAEELASDIRDYRRAGVDTMIFDVRRPTPAETLERMEWMAKEVFSKI